MDFQYKFAQDPGVGIYTLSGNLIGENDGIPITESFSSNIENGVSRFIIELGDLSHINSSGLGVLITLLTKARKNGGELVLSNPSAYIQNLLLITKLNTIFSIHASVEEALGSFVKV
jgi:anti-sigma B factor antagonist